jgi:DUF4097 and DUF4098 domain-containing protein YvlB|tara:strand:- start:7629 stop:8471 length:843 start_codon:yes stop_codon:yes gene_type:complete
MMLQPGLASARLVTETIDVEAGQRLQLRSEVGAVEVMGHAESTVNVDVEIAGLNEDDFEVAISSDSEGVVILGERKGRHRMWGRTRVRFTIRVPQEFDIDVRTSGGSITVENVAGKVKARTSGGSLRFDDIVGNIDAHTSGGSVSADNIEGDLDMSTSGGGFRVADVVGDVDLDTSGGSIRVQEVTGAVKATTSGGSITASFGGPFSKASELETSGGSLTVYLVDGSGVDVDAHSSGGRVRSEFAIDGRVSKHRAFGAINGGGARLHLNTSGGGIRIKKI